MGIFSNRQADPLRSAHRERSYEAPIVQRTPLETAREKIMQLDTHIHEKGMDEEALKLRREVRESLKPLATDDAMLAAAVEGAHGHLIEFISAPQPGDGV